jgi:hypothetical protein
MVKSRGSNLALLASCQTPINFEWRPRSTVSVVVVRGYSAAASHFIAVGASVWMLISTDARKGNHCWDIRKDLFALSHCTPMGLAVPLSIALHIT